MNSAWECSGLLLASILMAGFLGVQGFAAPVCRVPTLQESIRVLHGECPRLDTVSPPRPWLVEVAELNEATLETALNLGPDSFMAVLYYASWCPFSKQLRPVFHTVARMFPNILHAEVEESSIRPGLLSKYGVYSFPVLYLHMGSSRVRYSGTRSVADITKFYKDVTGMQPSRSKQKPVSGLQPAASERVQGDTYLTLATWYLVLRMLKYLLPLAVTRIKNFWNRCPLYKLLKRTPRQANEDAPDAVPLKRRIFSGWSHQIAAPSSSLVIRRVASADDIRR